MFKPAAVELPPIVFVSRTIPELEFDHVLGDVYESSQVAMKRLLRLGYRKIAFVGGVPGISCYHELLRGYKDALERASIGFDERLVRRIENPSAPTKKIFLKTKLNIRGTCKVVV